VLLKWFPFLILFGKNEKKIYKRKKVACPDLSCAPCRLKKKKDLISSLVLLEPVDKEMNGPVVM
jgi:hypothetical protein